MENGNCVFCSLNRDFVSLRAFIDLKGNQIRFQDVPKDCGYSVRINKHGRVQMRFQLHLRCQMSVQARFDTDSFFFFLNL